MVYHFLTLKYLMFLKTYNKHHILINKFLNCKPTSTIYIIIFVVSYYSNLRILLQVIKIIYGMDFDFWIHTRGLYK